MKPGITDITIRDTRYQLTRLSPIQQYHITRRIAPVLANLGVGLLQAWRGGTKVDIEDMEPLLEPMAQIISKMSDADSEYVIFTCLESCKREQGDNRFAPVAVNGGMMFDDIDMKLMLEVVFAVLRENLAGFIPGLSDDAAPSASA